MTALLKPGFPTQVAVLGAGLSGSQIAAHFANAKITTLLFDLPAAGDNPNASVEQAIARLQHLQPPPLITPRHIHWLKAANYQQHLAQLKECDLVIEAISEQLDDKEGFYARIAPYINKQAVFTSTTTGLSINRLAQALPENRRAHFCGMQFFNPPRYRRLVELIPNAVTDLELLDDLETFLVSVLGKQVVRAKDTPNFIANRIGLFALVVALRHAERYKLSPDVADDLVTAAFGLGEQSIFTTVDDIGLDTLAQAWANAVRSLPDDPWLAKLQLPAWFESLIAQGCTGQKAAAGVYRQHKEQVGQWQVFDPKLGDYRLCEYQISTAVQSILDNPDLGLSERFFLLHASQHPQAQFLWAILRDVLHYAATYLEDIADTVRDVDSALCWGFGWQRGLFETWQTIGWRVLADWLEQDRLAGKSLVVPPLPAWVQQISAVYNSCGEAYAPRLDNYKPCHKLPIYQRRLSFVNSKRLFEQTCVRLQKSEQEWALLELTKSCSQMTIEELKTVQESLAIAETAASALILLPQHLPAKPSNGKDITLAQKVIREAADHAAIEQRLLQQQQLSQKLLNLQIPVVAAVQQAAEGYTCELLLHCDRIVAALETRWGFPAVRQGLLPAGGGCAALLMRALEGARGHDSLPFLQTYFKLVQSGTVLLNAEQAHQWGLLRVTDCIIFNPDELLSGAKIQARALLEMGYRPTAVPTICVPGRQAAAVLLQGLPLTNRRDYCIAQQVARVLTGGDYDAGSERSHSELLSLERSAHLSLV